MDFETTNSTLSSNEKEINDTLSQEKVEKSSDEKVVIVSPVSNEENVPSKSKDKETEKKKKVKKSKDKKVKAKKSPIEIQKSIKIKSTSRIKINVENKTKVKINKTTLNFIQGAAYMALFMEFSYRNKAMTIYDILDILTHSIHGLFLMENEKHSN